MSEPAGRWRQLALLATVELLGMSVWFAASAVKPALAANLSLSAGQTGWLTSGVQLGFVLGTLLAAVLNLADIVPARRYVAVSALLAAIANAALLAAPSFTVAVATRVVTGAALAGVYPPAMKMAATWFREGRGLAIGAVVGALTAGKAMPYLLEGLGTLDLSRAVLVPSVAALLAAVLVFVGYRDGPFAFPARPFSWGLARVAMADPTVRRVTGGYLGHMWELYAFWTWVPGFVAASLAAHGKPPGAAELWAFAVVAIGAVGAVWGGLAADRIGRAAVVRWALVTSGCCALLSPLLFGSALPLLAAVTLVWGVAVIADSAQFSALVTEHAAPHAVGTALTLQTSLGFLLTIVTIQGVPAIVGLAGWRWAFVGLSLGPAAALWAVRGVGKRQRSAS